MVMHKNCHAGPEKASRRFQVNCISLIWKIFSNQIPFSFFRNMPKNISTTNRKLMANISWKLSERSRGGPTDSQDCCTVLWWKKKSTTFHFFCAKYFSSFRNLVSVILDTVTSPGAHTLQDRYYIPNLITKNTYSKNKLAGPKKSQK